MISLAKTIIEGTTVELTVEESIGSELGGYPILLIGNINIDSVMVAEVDTLAVIKAVTTSTTVEEFSQKICDVWNYEKIIIILKACCCTDIIDSDKMADTEHNKSIVDLIVEQCEILQGGLDEYSPWEKTVAESRIYDLNQKLDVI